MKHLSLVFVIFSLFFLFGCEGENVISPEADVTNRGIGEIHNEFLTNVYNELDENSSNLMKTTALEEEEILYQEAKKITDKYNQDPLTREQVREALERGRNMAKQDPIELVKSILSPEEYKWWDRFSNEATAVNLDLIYKNMCAKYGAPKPGTILYSLCDISIHSAEFWLTRHSAEEIPNIKIDSRNLLRGWGKRLLRFTVTVVVDGASGAAAGSGTGGNLIVAGVVGGLCSHAADDIIFGD
ncbi:MAG: hypothetical protein U5L76_04030 [Patescibacteria group bacterium]|nr:hypothetical protein [Patescibacteria group bacterium]